MIHIYDKCLKFSHKVLIFGLVATGASCGGPYTDSSSSVTNGLNVMLLENRCYSTTPLPEKITRQIKETYHNFEKTYPGAFLSVPTRLFDYQNPLLINLSSLERGLIQIQRELLKPSLESEDVLRIGEELHYLNLNISRYEAQKCAFGELSRKKALSIESFLKLSEFCYSKKQSYNCEKDMLKLLDQKENQFVETQALRICLALGNEHFLCQQEIGVEKKKKNLAGIASKLFNRFKSERFNKLFMLKSSHPQFSCVRNDDKIEMDINLKFDSVFELNKKLFADYVSEAWSNSTFKLNLHFNEENHQYKSIQIFPSANGLSVVPDQDTSKIFLNPNLNPNEQKRVLAHEFGHVLGFPDCYTEYYDAQNKNLVYFEMGEGNFNLMCSIKNGAIVPSEYLDQLKLNSCNF